MAVLEKKLDRLISALERSVPKVQEGDSGPSSISGPPPGQASTPPLRPSKEPSTATIERDSAPAFRSESDQKLVKNLNQTDPRVALNEPALTSSIESGMSQPNSVIGQLKALEVRVSRLEQRLEGQRKSLAGYFTGLEEAIVDRFDRIEERLHRLDGEPSSSFNEPATRQPSRTPDSR
jgi:hypothetical protein